MASFPPSLTHRTASISASSAAQFNYIDLFGDGDVVKASHRGCDHQLDSPVSPRDLVADLDPAEVLMGLFSLKHLYMMSNDPIDSAMETKDRYMVGYIMCVRSSETCSCPLYLVHWAGYSFNDSTWEAGCKLPSCLKKDFYSKTGGISWRSFKKTFDEYGSVFERHLRV